MYELDFNSLDSVNFNPPSDEAEIIQNVKTILTTPRFSVPLDRRFGVDTAIIDSPINIELFHRLQADIFDAVATYEPRVEVIKIDYKTHGDQVRPCIRFKIKGVNA